MGRVIIKLQKNHKHYFESYKCKSKERGCEIAAKFRNLIEWNYYEDGQRIPKPKKNVKVEKEWTLEEMERVISGF